MPRLLLIIVAACASCSPTPHPVEIRFDVRLNGEPVSCTRDAGGVRLNDLRFYVTDVRLRDGAGDWQPMTIIADDTWQNDVLALIDLEDGEGACQNGTPEQNAVLRGTVATAPGTGVAFTIGVPEQLNHADPLTADAPLAYTVMHWHWASGYKFLRAGVETDDDSFFLHLGSNRCAGTIGNIEGCQGANRVTAELTDFNAGENVIVIDVGTLFADVDLQNSAASECMSGPANNDCIAPFAALGIDFSSGEASSQVPAISAGPTK